MALKIEFFDFWRALVSDLSFSSFFFDFVALGLGTFVMDFNICFPKHCKNLGFLQVFADFHANVRFRGWCQNPSFRGP